jgi:hypothetical protein
VAARPASTALRRGRLRIAVPSINTPPVAPGCCVPRGPAQPARYRRRTRRPARAFRRLDSSATAWLSAASMPRSAMSSKQLLRSYRFSRHTAGHPCRPAHSQPIDDHSRDPAGYANGNTVALANSCDAVLLQRRGQQPATNRRGKPARLSTITPVRSTGQPAFSGWVDGSQVQHAPSVLATGRSSMTKAAVRTRTRVQAQPGCGRLHRSAPATTRYHVAPLAGHRRHGGHRQPGGPAGAVRVAHRQWPAAEGSCNGTLVSSWPDPPTAAPSERQLDTVDRRQLATASSRRRNHDGRRRHTKRQVCADAAASQFHPVAWRQWRCRQPGELRQARAALRPSLSQPNRLST